VTGVRGKGRVHVIGAGLAGLSAATRLAERGVAVTLSEGAAQAGGRCRSYHDPQLDLTIDNGNHLVLSGNRAVMTYLERLGAQDRLAGPAKADLAFMDLRDGTRWRLRPNDGPLAWWVFAKGRRVPGAKAADYLPLASLLWRHPGKRIDQVLKPQGVLWERLLEPFFLAALNTAAVDGSADLAGAFGGQGSQTAFGPRGAANLLTKLTTYSAVLFMLVSISLTILLARSSGDRSVLAGTPTQQTTPKK